MKYNFEEVEGLETEFKPQKPYNPRNPIHKHIEEMKDDTWIKITGFESVEEVKKTVRNFHSGERSIGMKLKKKGLRLHHKVDTFHKCIYVIKETVTNKISI